ncbi:hypothetical protein Lepto7375DRAFT_7317 [Leptolyngbya sp. PCC 7375]|nr:hypothetical protein Lepto7375DRAFT_7317 [Leptolyngbya sp. PCC 7375]
MSDFDYSVLDGDSTLRKIRGEDLGLDGSNNQIIGHKFFSDAIGAIADAAATDETGSSTAIALLKGALRELIAIASGSGGSGPSYSEGSELSFSVTDEETLVVTIDCRGKSRVGLIVQNLGGTALNSFQSKIRMNSSFGFHFPEATSTADYSTNTADQTGNATALVRKTNGDPTNLPADPGPSGSYVWIRYNVGSIESLEITATVASGSTTLNAWWLAE